ncbi:hypothetical protein TeGR_g323, partial [Tetraparma gracilis]
CHAAEHAVDTHEQCFLLEVAGCPEDESGAAANGHYEYTGELCNGKPMYQSTLASLFLVTWLSNFGTEWNIAAGCNTDDDGTIHYDHHQSSIAYGPRIAEDAPSSLFPYIDVGAWKCANGNWLDNDAPDFTIECLA